jgi:hypothetical protein
MSTSNRVVAGRPGTGRRAGWQTWVPVILVALIDVWAIVTLSTNMATLELKKAAMVKTPIGIFNVILLGIAATVSLAAYLFALHTFRPRERPPQESWWSGGYDRTRLVALGSVFGALAVAFSGIQARGLGGTNVNLGSTITFVVAATTPSLSLVWLVSLAKGVGSSVWSGNWYVEIGAAIADGFAASIAWYLATRTPLAKDSRLWITGVIGQAMRWPFDQIFVTPVWAVLLHQSFMATFVVVGLGGQLISCVGNAIVVALLLVAVGTRLKLRLSQ